MSLRFYEEPTVTKKYKRAYVIPYKTVEGGETQALIGDKKVIYYGAQESLEKGEPKWRVVQEKLIAKRWRDLFKLEGAKRLNGIFFPAGGKPTCFGGGINKNEDERNAAARELLEETGILKQVEAKEKELLKKEIITNLEILHTENTFDGIYFSLDLGKCPLLASHLTSDKISQENGRILNDERLALEAPLQKRIDMGLAKTISEMHQLRWEPLSELAIEIGKNTYNSRLQTYINNEMQRGVQLVFMHLFGKTKKEVVNNEDYKKCRNIIGNDLANEPTEGNVNAAQILQKKLISSDPKEKVQQEEIKEAEEKPGKEENQKSPIDENAAAKPPGNKMS